MPSGDSVVIWTTNLSVQCLILRSQTLEGPVRVSVEGYECD